MPTNNLSRRKFIRGSALSATILATPPIFAIQSKEDKPETSNFKEARIISDPIPLTDRWKLDLSPAKWIWFPAGRTLPNTFFHFRKTINIAKQIKKAKGWILGESRYTLFCNGQRLQFGPAPADPRFSEADPVDLTDYLKSGENVIGATVLFYGFGDGTWPMGKPGFIFKLDIEFADGSAATVASDSNWQVQLARSWRPGQYKRWYLRALQEDFDAVFYPEGWNTPGFVADHTWLQAAELRGNAWQTALSAGASDYLHDSGPEGETQLRARTIPMLVETEIKADRFVEAHRLKWNQDPFDYFDMLIYNAYEPLNDNPVLETNSEGVVGKLSDGLTGLVITWEMKEQVVGWPGFTIDAPEGTVVELMVQEGHRPYSEGGPALMNNHFHSWTRFRCNEGLNQFVTFDFESVKWIQLHIHGTTGIVKVGYPTVLRRFYNFPHQPLIKTSEPALQRLFDASVNTIFNNSQETIVDGMGRERQQYSGDIGHLIHSLHHAFGEKKLPARYLNTYSQGLTKDGFFMDCWPAYDRLNRLAQRQLDLTPWGPLLDHGVGFVFDTYYHFIYCGHTRDMEEVFPRIVRFYQYLRAMNDQNGLLPVENIGIPKIWIDHNAYQQQRHKQCAFNLYVAAMLKDAFAPLCEAFGKTILKSEAEDWSANLYAAARRKFFSPSEGLFINNLPWYSEEKKLRTCDRSLSHLILSDFIPESERTVVLNELETQPERMGLSYPPNAQWRLWALSEGGRIQTVVNEFREIWARMDSVILNNTMSEDWHVQPDSNSQWSHAACAPLYIAFMNIAGIAPLAPGSKKIRIWPQPADLEQFSLAYHTSQGPVHLGWNGKTGKRNLEIEIPSGIEAELWLTNAEKPKLDDLKKAPKAGLKAWKLKSGKNILTLLNT
jgi:alpha-L-rhamnosidase